MSQIQVDTILDKAGTGAPQLDYGAEVPVGYGITGAGGINISGVATATSFSGDGSGLTGVASTDNIITGTAVTITNTTDSTSTTTGALQVSGGVGIGLSMTIGGDVSIGGTLTYEDVTNVDSVGIVTARGGFEIGASGVGGTITGVGNAEFTGVCTATSFYGDGSTLTNAGITAGKAMGLASFLIY